MSNDEGRFFALKLASLICALCAAVIAVAHRFPDSATPFATALGLLSAGFGLVAAYFRARIKKQRKAKTAPGHNIGDDQAADQPPESY